MIKSDLLKFKIVDVYDIGECDEDIITFEKHEKLPKTVKDIVLEDNKGNKIVLEPKLRPHDNKEYCEAVIRIRRIVA